MANYTKTTDFAAKDTLPGGDTNKVVRGAEFETEFDAISTAIATKSDTASPTFTGTVTIPTVDINAGAIDGTTIGANSAAAGTFTNLNATTVDLDGGTLDGATIGGTTAGAGTFTNLTATGTVNFSGATISNLGTITTANLDGGTADNMVIGGSTAAAGTFTTLAATSATVGGSAVLTSVAFSDIDAGAVTLSSETFSDVDNQIPTNAAVIDYVAATIPLISEVNDLSAVVTWADVPDANITQSSVTQHQAALSITASQLSDVTSTASELNILDGVTSTASELNLVDGSSANTVVNSKAVIYGSAGEVTASQVDITGQGDLRLQDSTGGEYVALQAPATVGSSFTLTLPTADGTADQILKTDGSGNLGFTTVASGGLTHLSTVTASGASTVDIETTFDSTYDAYKLIINDLVVSSNGSNITMQYKIGGSYLSNTSYGYLHRRLGTDTAGQIYGNGAGNATSVLLVVGTSNDSNANANFELSIYNPTDTVARHIVRFEGSYYEDDGDIHYAYGIGQNSTTGALTGIRFAPASGTISGEFRLYGITNG